MEEFLNLYELKNKKTKLNKQYLKKEMDHFLNYLNNISCLVTF